MGKWFSKTKANVSSIETDVKELIEKTKDVVYIDEVVKHHVELALDIYLKQTKEKQKGNYGTLEGNILLAKRTIHNLATKDYEMKNIQTGDGEISFKHITAIKNQLTQNKNKGMDYERELQTLKALTSKLYACNHSQITEHEQKEINILFLKLFLKVPFSPDTVHVSKDRRNEVETHHNKRTADIKNETGHPEAEKNREDSKESPFQNLGAIARNYDENHDLTNKLTYYDKGIYNSRVHPSETSLEQHKIEAFSMVDKLIVTLKRNEEVIEKFCPLVDENAIIIVEYEINDVINNKLKQISEESPELRKKKREISEAGNSLLKKLENVRQSNKHKLENSLKRIEQEIFHVIDLNVSFEVKNMKLKEYKAELKEINSVCNDIHSIVTKITNQIESIIIVELVKYLRQISINIDQKAIEADQFPFPKKINAFETKRKEIEEMGSLLSPAKELPEEYFHIRKRVQQIQDKIVKVLDILDKKAEYNENVISTIENLENIKKEVSSLIATNSEKLHFFNQCRERMELVDDTSISKRILEKKIEVYYAIHNFEKNIFNSNFTSWQHFKSKLHANEKEALLLASPNFVETYNLIYQDVNGIFEQLGSRQDRLSQILCDTIRSIGKLLHNNFQRTKYIYDTIKSLNEVNNIVNNVIEDSASLKEKKKYLESYQRELDKIEKNIDHEEYLSTINVVEKNIKLKKYLVDFLFKETYLTEFRKQKNSLSCTVPSFRKIMDTVFAFTEVVDMPKGDEHFEARKQNFLKELVACLDFLDPRLVNLITQEQTLESILNLNEYFALDNNLANVPKNTHQFVDLVRKKAEELGEQAKNYLGANDSVDYYLINENLFQLLDELDNVLCGDDKNLLKDLVDAIDYIKGLIQQLELNVTN